MPNIGTTELILIVAVLLLLFGGSKLPQLARALGQSKKAFREGIDEAEKDAAKQLPHSSASNMSDEELFAEAHRRAQEAKKTA
jgi:sec-independent protein translocase protein TatA